MRQRQAWITPTCERIDVATAEALTKTPRYAHSRPAISATKSVQNAHQLALIERDLVTIAERHQALCDIARLLSEVPAEIAAVSTLLDRQERTIAEMRTENVRQAQYIERVETKNSELVQSVINLTRQLEELGADTSLLPRMPAGATA